LLTSWSPQELKEGGVPPDAWADTMLQQFRSSAAGLDPQGHVYVFSFARGSNEDQDRRGILTLWEHYTQNKGYCLQFEEDSVERFIEMEKMRGSYFWIELCDVRYGVDKQKREFKELAHQFAKRLVIQLSHRSGSEKIKANYNGLWAESAFYQKVTAYCGKHKDPAFADEREVRIFASPADRAESRIFTGIASKKQVRVNTSGKHYIDIGEFWSPGITPSRIIIGPNADPTLEVVLDKFEVTPDISLSNIPLKQ